MRIKSLQLRAKVVVEGFYTACTAARTTASRSSSASTAQYTPGDDPRYLDWRLYARSDRYYIKRFEDETNLRCHLLVDMSRSMGFGSARVHQGRLRQDGRRHAGLFPLDAARRRRPADVRRADHRVPPAALSARPPAPADAGAGAAPVGQGHRPGRRRWSRSPSIGDQAGPDRADLRSAGPDRDARRRTWATCARAATKWSCSACSTRPRRDFTFDEPAMFHDLESGRELYVDPDAARERVPAAIRRARGGDPRGVQQPGHRPLRDDDRPAAGTGAVRLPERPAASRPADRAARRARRARRPSMSFLTPLYIAGLAGRLAAAGVPPDPPHAAGPVSVQLADVPLALAAAADATEPAGQPAAAAAACVGAGAAWRWRSPGRFCARPPSSSVDRRDGRRIGRPGRHQRQHAASRPLATGHWRRSTTCSTTSAPATTWPCLPSMRDVTNAGRGSTTSRRPICKQRPARLRDALTDLAPTGRHRTWARPCAVADELSRRRRRNRTARDMTRQIVLVSDLQEGAARRPAHIPVARRRAAGVRRVARGNRPTPACTWPPIPTSRPDGEARTCGSA